MYSPQSFISPKSPIQIELDENVTKELWKKIVMHPGDITRVITDVIVNPINPQLSYGRGGINDAIHNACQPYRDVLLEELREKYNGIDKKICDLIVTPTYGNLSDNCQGSN